MFQRCQESTPLASRADAIYDRAWSDTKRYIARNDGHPLRYPGKNWLCDGEIEFFVGCEHEIYSNYILRQIICKVIVCGSVKVKLECMNIEYMGCLCNLI